MRDAHRLLLRSPCTLRRGRRYGASLAARGNSLPAASRKLKSPPKRSRDSSDDPERCPINSLYALLISRKLSIKQYATKYTRARCRGASLFSRLRASRRISHILLRETSIVFPLFSAHRGSIFLFYISQHINKNSIIT